MVKALKMGLVRYLSSTVADQMNISFPKQQQKVEQPQDDWDYWVYRLSSNGNFSGEKIITLHQYTTPFLQTGQLKN